LAALFIPMMGGYVYINILKLLFFLILTFFEENVG